MNYYLKFFFKRSYVKAIKKLIEKRYIPEDSFFNTDFEKFVKDNLKTGFKYLTVENNVFYFLERSINKYMRLNLKTLDSLPYSSINKKDYNILFKLNTLGDDIDGVILPDTYNNPKLAKKIFKRFGYDLSFYDKNSVVALDIDFYDKVVCCHSFCLSKENLNKEIIEIINMNYLVSNSRFLFEYKEELE